MRYALTGGLASIVNIGVYWVLAANGMDPNLAWTIGFARRRPASAMSSTAAGASAAMAGATISPAPAAASSRSSLVSFALNQLWVWLLVVHFGLPLWSPYPLVLGVTPLIVFALNRRWVFA